LAELDRMAVGLSEALTAANRDLGRLREYCRSGVSLLEFIERDDYLREFAPRYRHHVERREADLIDAMSVLETGPKQLAAINDARNALRHQFGILAHDPQLLRVVEELRAAHRV
jgi:hypothetical protein